MTEEEIYLQKRFKELSKRADNGSQYFFTGFLSMADISILHETCDKTGVNYTLWGGLDNSERQMARFGDTESIGYEVPFPIVILNIKPMIKKFADDLTHRDFLGAIMNLGIKRDTIGDIFVKDKEAYVFVDEKIADYILESLDKVKHTHIKVQRVEEIPGEMEVKKQEKEILVSSLRVDVVIAGKYKLSRNQALLLFRSQKVFVNGKMFENNSYQVKEGDIISVRGFGKMKFIEISNETRKGRFYIKVEEYI